jgi:hypothetical protein
MKVRVVVTDSDGNIFEGEALLVAVAGAHPRKTPDRRRQGLSQTSPDFSLPVRAFIKRYAKSLGGPQKFTVLLARLTGGKAGTTVSVREIEKAWNRMTELMGGRYNSAYTTRAKDNGWVDTPKIGSYALLPGWEKALDEK